MSIWARLRRLIRLPWTWGIVVAIGAVLLIASLPIPDQVAGSILFPVPAVAGALTARLTGASLKKSALVGLVAGFSAVVAAGFVLFVLDFEGPVVLVLIVAAVLVLFTLYTRVRDRAIRLAEQSSPPLNTRGSGKNQTATRRDWRFDWRNVRLGRTVRSYGTNK